MENMKKNRKILYVVRNLFRYSGAAKQALNLAEKINKDGKHFIEILNISDSEFTNSEEVIGNVIVHTTTRSGLKAISMWMKLFKSSSVVHYHGLFIKQIILSKIFFCKNILKSTLDGEDDFVTLSQRKNGWLTLKIINYCVDYNNSLTNIIKNKNKSLFRGIIFTFPNFVDINSSIKVKENLFIFVGAIVRRKRPDLALKFFLDNFSNKDSTLLFIGPKRICECKEDEGFYDQLKQSIPSRFKNNISFLGNIDTDQLSAIYSKALALLFFSEREGMPNVVLEAMSHNCVPITSTISGVAKEIIHNSKNGYIITDQDSVNINDVINISNSNAPYQKVRDFFSFKCGVKLYNDLYSEIFKK